MHALIRQYRPAIVFIERAQAMPEQGASSGFKFGRAARAIEAAVALAEIPLEIIEPATWKRSFKLRGKDKEAARQRARQLFPSGHVAFSRKCDHDRAEAALIALYGIQVSRLVAAPTGAQTGVSNELIRSTE
jgi:hypothetical protein